MPVELLKEISSYFGKILYYPRRFWSCFGGWREEIKECYVCEIFLTEDGEWGIFSPYDSKERLFFGRNVFSTKKQAQNILKKIEGRLGE